MVELTKKSDKFIFAGRQEYCEGSGILTFLKDMRHQSLRRCKVKQELILGTIFITDSQ